MKKILISFSILVVLIIGLAGFVFMKQYNEIVAKNEQVNSAWAHVESNIQRKMDLLPNVINTVKGFANHEKDVLIEITKLRTTQFPKKAPTVEEMKKIQGVTSSLNKSLMKINAVVENYPELKSSEQFLTLQSQLEGAENRINITRMNYNEAVKEFNSFIKKIPQVFIASAFGFKVKPYFKENTEGKELKVEL